MQGLHEDHAMQPVDEIEGFADQARVHQQQIERAVLAEKDDEGKYAGIGRQDNGQQNQRREDGFAPLAVACQDVCQGDAEDRGGHQDQGAQEQGVAEGFQIIGVLEEPQVVAYPPAAVSGDFETLQHQKGERIEHQKGHHRPQQGSQRGVAFRHGGSLF